MTDEQHFPDDFDEACQRIRSAAQTLLLLHRLPRNVVKVLQAIEHDAQILFQFGKDAEKLFHDHFTPHTESNQ